MQVSGSIVAGTSNSTISGRSASAVSVADGDDHHITYADPTTGEVLSVHLIKPDKTYWRNQQQQPGRGPSPPN
jgi:hypothetical protein